MSWLAGATEHELQLFFEADDIAAAPLLHHLAGGEAEDAHPRHRHDLAGRGQRPEGALVAAAQGPAHDHPTGAGDQVLDGDAQVGEGGVELWSRETASQ